MEEDPMNHSTTLARPRADAPTPPTRELARVEARRTVRHPAPWVGILLSALWLQGAAAEDWPSARYEGMVSAFGPLLLGVSMAAVTTFGRERPDVAEDAPMGPAPRAVARLLGSLPLVGLVAVIVIGGGAFLRASGGIRLGAEPGLTMNAHHSLPELLQPVLLGGFAVALGAAVVHMVRSQPASHVLVFVFWFLVAGTYWLFQGHVARILTPMQVQPDLVEVAPPDADPTAFPSDWLLSPPGEYQEFWGRLVVSPELAAWHDVYLVAVTALLVALAMPGRRRPLLLGGAVLAAGAVVMQLVVSR
jgi:hypothetical protein